MHTIYPVNRPSLFSHRWVKYSLVIFLFSIGLGLVTALGQVKENPIPRIKIDSSIRYQKIKGWGGTAQLGQNFPYFSKIQDKIVSLAVNDIGITRLTLGIFSSVENDHWIPSEVDKLPIEVRFNIKNDNNDPHKINWDGFQLSEVDATIEKAILPFRKALAARGESLYLNLCYVNLGPAVLHRDHPDEYAEFILAAFLHMKEKYGFVPDSVELLNEPDNSKWSGKDLGKAMVAAAKILKENGFQPDFIGPSTTDMENASRFFDEMIKVQGASDVLKEFSYHRYLSVSDHALQQIVSRAQKYHLRTSMNEFLGGSSKVLHQDLKFGNVSDWEQFAIAFQGINDPGGVYLKIDASDPSNPNVRMAKLTGSLRQYFHYIRPGAVRIETSSNDDRFDPLAFINQNGKYVVVIESAAASDIVLEGLPSGEYAMSLGRRNQQTFAEEDIPHGKPFIVRLKDTGVLTVFQK